MKTPFDGTSIERELGPELAGANALGASMSHVRETSAGQILGRHERSGLDCCLASNAAERDLMRAMSSTDSLDFAAARKDFSAASCVAK